MNNYFIKIHINQFNNKNDIKFLIKQKLKENFVCFRDPYFKEKKLSLEKQFFKEHKASLNPK